MLTDHSTESVESVDTACGLDGLAVKPTECDVAAVDDLPVETLIIDYEGRESLPDRGVLESLAETVSLRLTTPVRADGFDPLGDESLVETLPESVGRVLVAGHPAYLEETERRRAVAPRLGAAVRQCANPWVGTESVERIALATGATQFELLSGRTARAVEALRAAGFDGNVSVYAPTVVTEDEDEVLDAVGAYVARRAPVARAIPEGAAVDAEATGDVRETLLEAATKYALVGTESTVRERTDDLRRAGVSTVVGYPAAGLDTFFE